MKIPPQKIEEIRQEILNSDLSEEQKRELEKMLEDISKTEIHKNKSDNKFPVGWVFCGLLLLVELSIVVLINRRNKKNN